MRLALFGAHQATPHFSTFLHLGDCPVHFQFHRGANISSSYLFIFTKSYSLTLRSYLHNSINYNKSDLPSIYKNMSDIIFWYMNACLSEECIAKQDFSAVHMENFNIIKGCRIKIVWEHRTTQNEARVYDCLEWEYGSHSLRLTEIVCI